MDPISHSGKILALAGLLALTSCASQPRSTMMTIKGKLAVPFEITSTEPWQPTGIDLERGKSYHITSRIGVNGAYKDGIFPCTPEGPKGCLGKAFDWAARDASSWFNPFRWIGPGAVKRLRVLQDRGDEHSPPKRASFLTLIAAIGKDDAEGNVYVIGSERTITAHAHGELVLFANDWPGGPVTEGEERFFDKRTGCMISKSYRNNRGRLLVTVTVLPCEVRL